VVVGIDEMPRPEHWLTIELLQPLGFYPESNVNCWRSLVGAASIALRQDIPLVFADRPFEVRLAVASFPPSLYIDTRARCILIAPLSFSYA